MEIDTAGTGDDEREKWGLGECTWRGHEDRHSRAVRRVSGGGASGRRGQCERSPEAECTPAVLVANQKLIRHKRGHVQESKGSKLSRALGEARDGSGEGNGQITGVRLTPWGFHL